MYLWVGNRAHVDITVFAQNAMYNIQNCGTPYAELPVCGEHRKKSGTQNKANQQRTVCDKDFDTDISHKIHIH